MLAYLLVRQVTSLIQRTRLNVSIVCQAWHAKNSRHLLLGIIIEFRVDLGYPLIFYLTKTSSILFPRRC